MCVADEISVNLKHLKGCSNGCVCVCVCADEISVNLRHLKGCVCVCVCVCVCSVSSAQQEHEEDCAEQDAECAHSGDHNLRYHLHVTGQGI